MARLAMLDRNSGSDNAMLEALSRRPMMLLRSLCDSPKGYDSTRNVIKSSSQGKKGPQVSQENQQIGSY